MLFCDLQRQRARIDKGLALRFTQVLTRGEFIQGDEVRLFEEKLAVHVGCPHVVSCSSGSDALFLALLAHGIGPGDAVFVPAFTFVATAAAVVRVGATPVFIDVEPGRFTIGRASLSEALDRFDEESTEGVKGGAPLRAAGIIAVDLFGEPCDYEELQGLADARDLLLFSDAAQSLGGSRGDAKVGDLAACTAASFFPTKPLGCYGDGGAVLCRDGKLAHKLRSLRSHGRREGRAELLGWNCRLDTLQAAVLLEKLPLLEEERRERQRIAAFYSSCLEELVDVPNVGPGVTSAWAQYSVLLREAPKGNGLDRCEIVEGLKKAGVPSRVYYDRPLHLEPAYRAWSPSLGVLSRSEELSRRVLSLPIHPYLREDEVLLVVEAMKKVLS